MRLRRLIRIAVIAVAAVAVAAVALVMSFDRQAIGQRVARDLTEALGRQVTVGGEVGYAIGLTPELVLRDVTLANIEGGSQPVMARFAEVTTQLRLWPLLTGDMEVTALAARDGELLLEYGSDGRRNWAFEEGAGGTGALSDLASLRLLAVDLRYPGFGESERLVRLDEVLATGAASDMADLTVSGSADSMPLSLDGTTGGLDALFADSADWPVDLDLAVGEAALSMDGAVGQPLSTATFSGVVEIDAPEPEPVVAVLGVAQPEGMPISAGATIVKEQGGLTMEDLTATVGDTSVAGRLTVSWTGPKPNLTGDLAIDAVVLGLDGGEGTLGQALEPLQTVNGDLSVTVDRLTIFGQTAEAVSANLRIVDGRLTADISEATLWDGAASGAVVLHGGMSPPLVGVDMSAADIDVGALLEEVSGRADLEVRVEAQGEDRAALLASLRGQAYATMGEGTIEGTALERLGEGILSALAPSSEADQTAEIVCASGAFAIREGVARTEQFVIALADTTVTAEGAISLIDGTVDAILTPQPRDPSLFEVATSVRIHGPIADPEVEVDARDALLQGAAGLLLGAINPLAAVVPFIAAGEGGDGNPCVAALSED